ncbi:MAG: hypothetical protein GX801_01020 [Fibrobacter sp.]|nr:hypothetical protein [Fibrobacter sp.]
MNQRNILILSVVLNVLFIGLLFYVKKDAHSQAQKHVSKVMENVNHQLKQAGEINVNNNVLWELVIDIKDAKDKSLTNVTRLAKSKRLPNRENEEAFLAVDAASVEGKKARRIGWGKYNIVVTFNDRDIVESIDIDDLLGKLVNQENEEDEE